MKRLIKKIIPCIVCFALLFTLAVPTTPAKAERFNPNTDWMVGKYGIMLHYLPGMVGSNNPTIESWNETVDSFDTEKFADDMVDLGCSWVLFTLTQADGRYPMPLPEWDEMCGSDMTADRDLVEDLYQSLNKRGIKLMLYWYPNAPSQNPRAAREMGAVFRRNSSGGAGESSGDWMLNWDIVESLKILYSAVAQKYGDKIAGWWFDGSYTGVGFNERVANYLGEAIKSGNPNTIISFNNGTSFQGTRFEIEDFSCGELNNPYKENATINFYEATSRYTEMGTQQHYLTYLGTNWGHTGLCLPDTNLFVTHVYEKMLARGAAVTFDVASNDDGSFEDQAQYDQIKALKNYVAGKPAAEVNQPKPEITDTPVEGEDEKTDTATEVVEKKKEVLVKKNVSNPINNVLNVGLIVEIVLAVGVIALGVLVAVKAKKKRG